MNEFQLVWARLTYECNILLISLQKEPKYYRRRKSDNYQLQVHSNCQGSGIGHVANNYLRPILLLPKKTGFR